MATFRTPEERFDDVREFPYDPSYVEAEGLRMAYYETGIGPETFLCLHGVPTWGYLYRTMIPRLADVGRVVVPDLVGHGRSDKFTEMEEYSFDLLYDTLAGFVRALDLTDVTLVCQDWGGILGFCLVDECPERFARLVPMNFGAFSRLQTVRRGDAPPESLGPFGEWQEFCRTTPNLPIGRVMREGPSLGKGHVSRLDDATVRAYEAPFPTVESKAGVRALPLLVPTEPSMDGAERMTTALETLETWERPAFVLFSDGDPITRGGRAFFREFLPTASEQPDVWIRNAGHYLQEDAGPEIADRIVSFVERSPRD